MIYKVNYNTNYNTGCPYSDTGTEYGHPRYLWNQKIKYKFKIIIISIII